MMSTENATTASGITVNITDSSLHPSLLQNTPTILSLQVKEINGLDTLGFFCWIIMAETSKAVSLVLWWSHSWSAMHQPFPSGTRHVLLAGPRIIHKKNNVQYANDSVEVPEKKANFKNKKKYCKPFIPIRAPSAVGQEAN